MVHKDAHFVMQSRSEWRTHTRVQCTFHIDGGICVHRISGYMYVVMHSMKPGAVKQQVSLPYITKANLVP